MTELPFWQALLVLWEHVRVVRCDPKAPVGRAHALIPLPQKRVVPFGSCDVAQEESKENTGPFQCPRLLLRWGGGAGRMSRHSGGIHG